MCLSIALFIYEQTSYIFVRRKNTFFFRLFIIILLHSLPIANGIVLLLVFLVLKMHPTSSHDMTYTRVYGTTHSERKVFMYKPLNTKKKIQLPPFHVLTHTPEKHYFFL